MFCESLAGLLERSSGMNVIFQGSNGQELLDAIRLQNLRPDIYIIDVAMPVLNGFDTVVALKQVLPDAKVLILTMMDHEFNILRFLRVGVNGYLLKEEAPEVLVEAIHTIMKRDFFSTEFVSSRLSASARKGMEGGDFKLSEKEKDFLRLCPTDMAYKEIAAALGVSIRTVEGYRNTLFERLRVKSRTGLALFALQTGLKVLRSS
jgi:DNA-binding NarL/FixJ family response regulator